MGTVRTSRFQTLRAIELGFTADSGIEAILNDYIASEGITL